MVLPGSPARCARGSYPQDSIISSTRLFLIADFHVFSTKNFLGLLHEASLEGRPSIWVLICGNLSGGGREAQPYPSGTHCLILSLQFLYSTTSIRHIMEYTYTLNASLAICFKDGRLLRTMCLKDHLRCRRNEPDMTFRTASAAGIEMV